MGFPFRINPQGSGAPAAPGWLRDFLARFVPSEVNGVAESVERVHLAIAVGWLMVPVFLILAVAHAVSGAAHEALLNVFLAVAMAGAPLLFRLTGRYYAVLNGALTLVWISVSAVAITERGAGITAATVALAELPLFATLLAGIRTGGAWALISGVTIVVIGFLASAGLVVERTPVETRLFDEHAALLVITGTLFLVAALYELNKQRSLRQIAALEQRRAQVEREKIEAQAQARVSRAERLASLGRIAAAVAHEINNPLSFVGSNVEYVQRELEGSRSPQCRDALHDAANGIERIRRIVADLKVYTRPEDDALTSVDVTRALATALKMAEGHTRPKAKVRIDMREVPRVVGNETRLIQVFLTLLVNAAQALPEGPLDNEILVRAHSAGKLVQLEIEDTGPGIPPELLEHVTDAVFTTRAGDEGTGLGLALCKSIVESVGGRLEFESRPGATIARVTLVESPDSGRLRVAPPSSPPASPARPGALLIIDDEPLVGRSLQRTLTGHHVTVVSGGRQALELLAQGRRFDMILCDMMMPELSGMEIYAKLRTLHPELLDRLAFMTGGTFTERAEEFRATVPNPFLDKPLNTDKVQALLAICRVGSLIEAPPSSRPA